MHSSLTYNEHFVEVIVIRQHIDRLSTYQPGALGKLRLFVRTRQNRA